jgi:uncharacterized protein (DUF433 family)
MDWRDRIVSDPQVLVGKPVIKGTRLAVSLIVSLTADGWSREQILQNYPQLADEDISAALQYAAEIINEQQVFPLAAI